MHETFKFPIPKFHLKEIALTYFLDQKSVQQVEIVGAEILYAEERPEWTYLVEGCTTFNKDKTFFLVHESDLISMDPEKLSKEFITPVKVEKHETDNQ